MVYTSVVVLTNYTETHFKCLQNFVTNKGHNVRFQDTLVLAMATAETGAKTHPHNVKGM